MRNLTAIIFSLLVLCGLAAFADISAKAAGAIAIGQCNRVGYSYNVASASGASARALTECRAKGDRSCHVVVTLSRTCGAFAVAGLGGCKARGWAYAGSRAAAENLAMANCRKYGGTNCHIQAYVCDGGG